MGSHSHGMALPVEPHLPREDRVETMAARHCTGLNPVSGSVICIEAIDDLLTECITTMVVRIYRSLATHMDHWWSAEGCGAGPGWGPVCMGCAYAHQDDGIVEPMSVR
jgi:hypothetical protein